MNDNSKHHRHRPVDQRAARDADRDHQHHLNPDADLGLDEVPQRRAVGQAEVAIGLGEAEVLGPIEALHDDFQPAVFGHQVLQADRSAF